MYPNTTDDILASELENILYRHLKCQTTQAEDERLFAWLEASEGNRRFYFEIAAIWSAHRTLSSRKLDDNCEAMKHRLNARIDADEAMRAAVPERHPARRRWKFAAAAAAAVVAVAAVWFAGLRMTDAERFRTYVNATGEVAALQLGDGTQVWVQAGTELRYDVEKGDRRTVRLVGEAYFDVAHDAQRPFVVETRNLDIRVLGTAFNVRATGGDPLTEIVLERGSVRLETPEGANLVRLRPNQRAIYDAERDDIEVEEVNASLFMTKRYDLVSMKNATVSEIVAGIEKNYGVQLRVTVTDDSRHYDINYLRSNSLEEVIDIVEFMTGCQCEVAGGR